MNNQSLLFLSPMDFCSESGQDLRKAQDDPDFCFPKDDNHDDHYHPPFSFLGSGISF